MEKRNDAARTLSFLLVTVAVYLFLWQWGGEKFHFPVYYYSRLIEVLAVGLFAALFLFTPMEFSKMGILVKKEVLFRSLALGGLVGLAFLFLLALFSYASFHEVSFSLALNGDISRMTYFIVAPFQEVLGKSVMLYSFERVFGEEHPHRANAMTALTFGTFHVVYGIRMMLLAALLSLVTGLMFRRERCVWGCALAHFSCGFFPLCFGIS